ncbi:MAG TPA: ATP-binding cassette domain-containing protein [Thermoanaerobaculia bacterium]|nr:ATP-binding cassette domain-containing protein [Thermoanaerobaculia bacterium]
MLEIRGIRKSFGETLAVREASLTIPAGQAVAVVGANGAGKTTLMEIVAGAKRADAGEVLMEGERVGGSGDAARLGIRMVHQHFDLAESMTVAENLALHDGGLAPLFGRRGIERVAREIVARSGLALENLERPVAALSVGEAARVELVRALSQRPRLLILDEPTSVLTPREVEDLVALLRRLTRQNTAVVLISHKLAEVFAFAERIVVMREGAVVADGPSAATTREQVARAMIGRDLRTVPPSRSDDPHPVRLRLTDLATSPASHRVPLRGVDLELRAGRISAIVGVAGNGQNALADALRGLAQPSRGHIEIDGAVIAAPALFRSRRLAHIPSDRAREGIVRELTVAENLALRARRWSRGGARARARAAIARFGIRGTPDQAAGSLSGGNQQKLILARELERAPEVIVASEPTRGLDFDAARFVHERLRAAAAAGAAVLVITSDLDEAASLADEVRVISAGSLSEPLAPDTPAAELGLRMAGTH